MDKKCNLWSGNTDTLPRLSLPDKPSGPPPDKHVLILDQDQSPLMTSEQLQKWTVRNELHERHGERPRVAPQHGLWYWEQGKIMPRTLKAPASAPLHPWPEKPWRKLCLDYAGPFMGSDHGCALKVGRCIPLVSDTSATTINCLRNSFSKHGVPEMTVSKYAACFVSE